MRNLLPTDDASRSVEDPLEASPLCSKVALVDSVEDPLEAWCVWSWSSDSKFWGFEVPLKVVSFRAAASPVWGAWSRALGVALLTRSGVVGSFKFISSE